MGNRHHDKKLRAEVRARMARTGETYQQALDRLRVRRRAEPRVDLVPFDWFGAQAALAPIEKMGVAGVDVVSAPLQKLPFAVHVPRAVS